MSNSLWPHESQHARPPCPSPTPGVYSNSCPSSRWCHPASSSSVVPFFSCPQSLPALGSFPTSQLFTWVESFSFSISPSNEHPGLLSFRMDCLDLLAAQGTLRAWEELCRVWDFTFYSWANELTWHSFINASKRYKTSWSETKKDFPTLTISDRVLQLVPWATG